jgi:hypothetical protein
MSTTGEVPVAEDRLRALEVALATLSATLTTKLDTLIGGGKVRLDDHEIRIRAVEAKILRWSGVATLGGTVFGGIVGAVISHYTGG